jgi:translin
VSETVVAGIEAHLRQRELRRDELFQRARRLRRLAQGTMTRMHEGHDLTAELAEIHKATVELADWVRREARGDEALAHDAFQESVEASLLGAVIARREIPGPQELGVDPEPYLLGLGDLVGEVRRLALDRIADGNVAAAEEYLRLMERLHRTLMRFDTTRGIVALKPKQDTARALLERTRGEVTMARMLARHRPDGPGPPGAPE